MHGTLFKNKMKQSFGNNITIKEAYCKQYGHMNMKAQNMN